MEIQAPRKKWMAMVLSIIMPGLGQSYCGELLRGGCFFVFFVFFPLIIVRITVALPDYLMMTGLGVAATAALGSYMYGVIDSFRMAASDGAHYRLKSSNTPLFYVAAWLVGTSLIMSTDHYLKTNFVQAFKIVTPNLAPQVLKGDYVLVKKPAYRNRPLKVGDVVILVYPDDRSKFLIRKIIALPGQQWNSNGNKEEIVPHGMVAVIGTAPPESVYDSHDFGPVDMRDIVGRATQIYLSREGLTLQWARIGTLINK